MKVVISGGSDIGYLCARELAPHHDLFVIEMNAALLERLEQLDVQIVSGNPTSLEVLREAQVSEADFFIAAAHSDEVNIISSLAVKQLSKAKTFCFVNKAHYFETFLGELGEHLIIDHLVWPEKLLAEDISRIITVPGATDIKVFEKDDLKLL
ncbi:MAG TPA: NAD-binding protein, partial [Candidatus Ozemobacteraceae bacterium]|nr:NAD-binding protein [Candidatus Ozemobacteraceae bacterium]